VSVIEHVGGAAGAAGLCLAVGRVSAAYWLGARRRVPAAAATPRGERLTQVILAITARFAGLGLDEVDGAIQSALGEIGTFLEVDRVQLFRLADDQQSFGITHEWCAPAVPQHIGDLQRVGREHYPWLWRTIEASSVAVARDVDLLPAEAARERVSLRLQGVKSFACVAVHRHGRPVGFLALDVLSHLRPWPEDEIALLRVVADVLSNALARRQAEVAVRDSEQRFVKAFRSSPAPMLIVRRRDERTTEVNDAFLRAFDVDAGAVLGRGIAELELFAVPGDLSAVREFLARELPLRDFEVTLRAGTGEIRHGLLSVDLFEAGAESSYLVVIADLTERRRAEEALREREEIFRSISAAAQDAIVMADPDGCITVWNEAAERMFGYAREEAVGQLLHGLIVPERYEDRSALGLAQFRETGRGPLIGPPQQIVGRRKDGRELPVELSISAIHLRGGWHAVAIIRDITERLKVEEALWNAKEQTEAANLELQRSVERANRLAEEAAVANATKSEFLANMSHEIRTPMNGIIGMSGLLLDTPLTPEQAEYVETVRSCADSLLTIINDILDFSKIEAGRLQLEVLDFDLAVTLEEMTDMLAVRAHEKDLELTCLIAPDVPRYLCGDPGRLRQVLTNLVGNGVKFTEAGEVNIEVAVEEDVGEQVVLRFAVKDTGIGIPAEKVATLFKPFTQVDSSMTRRFGGTGLGLSISRQLTQLMGGRIGVESEVGSGSTFWFTARFGRQARPEPAPLPRAEIAGLKVLGADDNAANRRVLAGLFKSWGCVGEVVEDGATALARLRAAAAAGEPFRVAMVDMMMPQVTGEELGSLVKQDPAIRDTILVMMTSGGRRGDAARMAELGFAAYLTKPVKASHLRGTLQTLVSHAGVEHRVHPRPIVTRFTLAEAARRRPRILLAEDNITNQRVARALLEKMDHRVDTVANGREALRALGSIPYDLVLMDVQMPEMDGFEATRAIRNAGASVRNPSVPIVAMTAHAMKGDRERCLAAGMDDYVAKPIRPAELAAAIARWTSRDSCSAGGDGLPETVDGEREAPGMVQQDAEEAGPGASCTVREQSQQVLDRPALLDRVGGDETILAEIVKVFLEDTPRQIQAMEAAAGADDRLTLRRLAHSLKGSAGTVGANALQATALALEQHVDRGEMPAARALVAAVREHYAAVECAMTEWVPNQERA
jgi:PAS domain S-box-containing protein